MRAADLLRQPNQFGVFVLVDLPFELELSVLRISSMTPPQFSVFQLLGLATVAAVLCGATVHLGIAPLAIAITISSILALWTFLYHFAPRATLHFSILGIVAFCVLSIMTKYLLLSRRTARQHRQRYELREYSIRIHQGTDAFVTSTGDDTKVP